MRLFLTTLLLTYLLTACGLKGPLYMPPPADAAKPASSDEVEKK
ncbi:MULTISPECIES: lipoprotein [unclassified Nitrosomonas]